MVMICLVPAAMTIDDDRDDMMKLHKTWLGDHTRV